jgi:hypothetical protein
MLKTPINIQILLSSSCCIKFGNLIVIYTKYHLKVNNKRKLFAIIFDNYPRS